MKTDKIIEDFRDGIDKFIEIWANDPEVSFDQFSKRVNAIETAFNLMSAVTKFTESISNQNNNNNETGKKY